MELLTPGCEHHEIGDGGGLVMTKIEDPPLRSPKRTLDLALLRGFRAWRRLRIVKRDDFFSPIFSLRNQIYRVGFGIGGFPGGPTR